MRNPSKPLLAHRSCRWSIEENRSDWDRSAIGHRFFPYEHATVAPINAKTAFGLLNRFSLANLCPL